MRGGPRDRRTARPVLAALLLSLILHGSLGAWLTLHSRAPPPRWKPAAEQWVEVELHHKASPGPPPPSRTQETTVPAPQKKRAPRISGPPSSPNPSTDPSLRALLSDAPLASDAPRAWQWVPGSPGVPGTDAPPP